MAVRRMEVTMSILQTKGGKKWYQLSQVVTFTPRSLPRNPCETDLPVVSSSVSEDPADQAQGTLRDVLGISDNELQLNLTQRGKDDKSVLTCHLASSQSTVEALIGSKALVTCRVPMPACFSVRTPSKG